MLGPVACCTLKIGVIEIDLVSQGKHIYMVCLLWLDQYKPWAYRGWLKTRKEAKAMLSKFGEFFEEWGGGVVLIVCVVLFVAACFVLFGAWMGLFFGIYWVTSGLLPEGVRAILAIAGATVVEVLAGFGLWLLFNRSKSR